MVWEVAVAAVAALLAAVVEHKSKVAEEAAVVAEGFVSSASSSHACNRCRTMDSMVLAADICLCNRISSMQHYSAAFGSSDDASRAVARSNSTSS